MLAVKKAVIPAAGLGTRQYPASACVKKAFFPLVDRDGRSKPVLQIVIEEALAGGVEEVCIVGLPAMEESCRRYFRAMPDELRPAFEGKEWAFQQAETLRRIGERLSFVAQTEQHGLGHAVWCARRWIGDEPFLVLLGDHVFLSASERPCSAQLIEAFSGHSITALTPVGEEQLPGFGVVRGRPSAENAALVHAEGFIEKPPVEVARARCRVEGVPEGVYLAHFGMHLFTPGMLEVLDEMVRSDRRERGEFQLTAAQDILCRREPYFGLVIEGERYDMGTPEGMLEAQAGLLKNRDSHLFSSS